MPDRGRPRDEGNAPPTGAFDEDSGYLYTAEIVVARDQPAECILFEQTPDGSVSLTTWITAREGSFVSLETME